MASPVQVRLALSVEERQRWEEQLSAVGLEVEFSSRGDDWQSVLPGCRYLLVGRAPRIDWSSATELCLLQVAGAGMDPLFPARGLRPDTHVANCRGLQADAVRDHVLAAIFYFARDLPRAVLQQARAEWRPFARAALSERRITVVGLGEIGTRVAEAARALGMRVTAVRRTAQPSDVVETVLPCEALREALADADYVVLCAPLTTRTQNLMGAPELAVLPERAVLINVGRGGLVDEAALEKALRNGELRGAALDVFREEPLPAGSALWSCPRLLITPHVAGWTPDYLERVLATFIDNVRRVESGRAPLSLVSREDEY